MTSVPGRPRIFYGWYIIALSFGAMLVVSGIRSASSVLITPIVADMHWTVAQVSIAIAINVVLFGAMGPFAAAMMQRYGIRNVMLSALAIMALATAVTSRIRTPFELWLTWGVGVGVGVGMVSMVLGSYVAIRWFHKHQGLVQGIMISGNSMGQLIFLPGLALIATKYGWRPVGLVVAATAVLLAIPVFLYMRNRPEDIGLRPYGTPPGDPVVPVDNTNPLKRAYDVLKKGLRNRDFLLVSGTFFVCGASSNGFIGTHFIPLCGDHGVAEVQAAGLLAVMGAVSMLGTMLAGWLSDRFRPGPLLAIFYFSRAVSLVLVTFVLDGGGVWILPYFTIFYGIDWLTTGAPNVRALVEALGREDAPIAFGWISVAHSLGAGLIALVSGMIRTGTGSYNNAFAFAAVLCVIATVLSLGIGGKRRDAEPTQPLPAPAPA
jgi:predicted MFS family arabinose efflux permease